MNTCRSVTLAAFLLFVPQFFGVFLLRNVVEITVIIHHPAAVAAEGKIKMILADVGPGIPDVKLAMQAGYSTAPDEIRSLGFGAGMGLPNMKKYSDSMDIDTRIGEGTTITMVVNL